MPAGGFDGTLDRIARLFDTIAEATSDPPGVTRDAYGPGEQRAHDIIARVAREHGLDVEADAALNLRIVRPGRRRDLPAIAIGSHLDSVPHGGNFDGLAGVLAGLAVLCHREAGAPPPERDLLLLALRGEENAWFAAQHVGSRAALGRLSEEALDGAVRIDTRRGLAVHMVEAGADLAPIRRGEPLLDPRRIACFLECHIEQGDQLVEAGLPVGIVTGIRGSWRCREVTCIGEGGHSGSTPRNRRRDAVLATADLLARLEAAWIATEAAGGDLVVTFGVLSTDPASHGVTVIPGRTSFTIDMRSHSEAVLATFWERVRAEAAAVAAARGVDFRFGPLAKDVPVPMDGSLRALIAAEAAALSIPTMDIGSGAGHDAGDFGAAGIPAAMIFIRNRNGSHNPDEAMDIDDFKLAARTLRAAVERLARP